MLSQASVYAFVDIPLSTSHASAEGQHLTNAQLLDAQRLLDNASRKDAWATCCEIKFSEVVGIEVDSNSSSFPEFINTSFGIEGNGPDRTIIIQENTSQDPGPNDRHSQQILEENIIAKRQIKPLFEIIPEPHYYSEPPPSAPFDNVVRSGIGEYPVFRYVESTVRQLFPRSVSNPGGAVDNNAIELNSTPFTTWHHNILTWIVPVHGRLPWSDTSTAQVVSEDQFSWPPVSKPADQPEILPITWTPTLLQAFWSHLLRYYRRNVFPSISLSFLHTPLVHESGDIEGIQDLNAIHVRCRGEAAMKLRKILAAFIVDPWKFIDSSKGSPGELYWQFKARERPVDKEELRRLLIAPLRTAKLPLIDENSRLLLIA